MHNLICPKCGWKTMFPHTLHLQMDTPADGDYCMRCWVEFLAKHVTKLVPDLSPSLKKNYRGASYPMSFDLSQEELLKREELSIHLAFKDVIRAMEKISKLGAELRMGYFGETSHKNFVLELHYPWTENKFKKVKIVWPIKKSLK